MIRNFTLSLAAILAAAAASAHAQELTPPHLTLDPLQVAPPEHELINPLYEDVEEKPTLRLAEVSSYELPPVKVEGQKEGSGLKEEERVGPYKQPRWTTTRRFPTTRVYVIPEGAVGIEYWIRPTFRKDGRTDIRSLYEVEFGLPYRLQIDLYFRTDQNTKSNDILLGGQFEVRWAVADWGVIPGNPTFYMEYIQLENRPNRIEPKLLLADEIAPRWHWALNIVWEQEIGRASAGEGEHELEFDVGISYSLIDNYLGIGIETIVNFNNTRDNRSSWATEIYAGPSINWKPIEHLNVNFTPMVGCTDEAGVARLYLNVGWEF